MIAWVAGIPLFLLAVALFAVPGWMGAKLLRLGILSSLGFAPVIGIAAVGVWTLLFGFLGLPWGWGAYVSLLVLLLLAWAVTRRLDWYRDAGEVANRDRRLAAYQGLLGVLGVLAFAAIQLWAWAPAMGTPSGFPHLGDSDFHLQGAILVQETGNVFPIGGLADLYTPDESGTTYYPTLWHGAGALLLSFGPVIEVSNALVVALAIVFWPVGVAVLGASLLPRNRYVTFWAPLSIAPLAVFPGTVGIGFSIFPFALATVTLPAGIAALVFYMKTKSPRYFAVYLLAVVGGVIAQPTVAIFTAVAGMVALVVVYVRWLRRSIDSRTWVPAAAVGAAVVVVGVAAMIYFRHHPYLVRLASYPRPQQATNPTRAFFDGTVAAVSQPWTPWIIFVVAAVAGIVITGRYLDNWIVIAPALIAVVAFIAAAGPDSTLRALTGPWYKDHLRLASFATMFTCVLAAAAIAWLTERVVPASLSVPSTTAAFGALGTMIVVGWMLADPSVAKIGREHVANGYTVDEQEFTPITVDSVPLMERLDEHFEAGDRLLSAHGNGGGFVVAFSELKPFIPTRTLLTAEQRYLGAHLDDIHTDPKVCEIIEDHNITAFMADTEREGSEIWGPLSGPPLLDVDEGFELVDQQGSIKVWRITACN